jgi:hypothetical protein
VSGATATRLRISPRQGTGYDSFSPGTDAAGWQTWHARKVVPAGQISGAYGRPVPPDLTSFSVASFQLGEQRLEILPAAQGDKIGVYLDPPYVLEAGGDK